MFKLIRLLRFLGPVLLVAGSILGLLFALSVITELRAYQVSLADVWPFYLLPDPSRPIADLDFWLFVLLNMVPGLVAVVVVWWLAVSFVQSLYGLKSKSEGWSFLVYSVFGRPGLKPYLLIREGAILGDEAHVLRKVGGPGSLIIFNDSAVVLEKAGRLTRVIGSGFASLEPFEKVWDVIDLRPQRWEFAVNAMTQEGIPVTCNADISFKIDDGGQKSTLETPHPMTEGAVFKAATSKWIREAWRTEPDRLMTWTKQVIIGETEGTLRSILARYPLDQLIDPAIRRKMQAELEESLRRSVPDMGAKIIRVALGDIQLEDAVTQQWIEKWQVEGRRRMMELEAKGQAELISIELDARLQAQLKMISNAVKIFNSMAKHGERVSSHLVILRFIEMIKRTSFDLLGRLYLPRDVMQTFEMLERRIGRMQKGERKGLERARDKGDEESALN